MLNSKEFAEALKQRYNQRSPQSSVRNVKVEITNPKKDKEDKERKDREDLEKMEFFKSKKAKDGMPDSIRQKMLIKLREKMKKSAK